MVSFTPSKLAYSCLVLSSAILILLFLYEDQASSFGCEGMFSISKKGSCQWQWRKVAKREEVLPMLLIDFFVKSLWASTLNRFDSSSTILDECSLTFNSSRLGKFCGSGFNTLPIKLRTCPDKRLIAENSFWFCASSIQRALSPQQTIRGVNFYSDWICFFPAITHFWKPEGKWVLPV